MIKKILLITLMLLFLSGCSLGGDIEIVDPIPTKEDNSFYSPLYHFLDVNGDFTGNIQVTGNYLATPSKFYAKPSPDQIYTIERMLIFVEDSGSFDATKYGNGITLVNGITVYVIVNGVQYNLTNTHRVFTSGDWAALTYDVTPLTFGVGNEILVSRWTFSRGGQALILNGANGDEFGIIVNDDFTGLVQHHFHIQGYINSEVIY